MFLALRELRFARARFLIMGSVVSLVTVLMVMLSGLSVGLVNDGVSGLQKLPVDSFAFEKGVPHDSAFSRSVVQLDAVESWRREPGVQDAAPFGNTLVNGHTQNGKAVDLALFGVEPGSFVAPEATSGRDLGDAQNEIVVVPDARGPGSVDRRHRDPRPHRHRAHRRRVHVRPSHLRPRRRRVHAPADVAARHGRHPPRRDGAPVEPSTRSPPWPSAARDVDFARSANEHRHRHDDAEGVVRRLAGLHRGDVDAAADPGVPVRHLRTGRGRVLHRLDDPAPQRDRGDARHRRTDRLPPARQHHPGRCSC